MGRRPVWLPSGGASDLGTSSSTRAAYITGLRSRPLVRITLFLTLVSGSSPYYAGHHLSLPRHRTCAARGSPTVSAASACFVQVHPPSKRPRRGTRFTVQLHGSPSRWALAS